MQPYNETAELGCKAIKMNAEDDIAHWASEHECILERVRWEIFVLICHWFSQHNTPEGNYTFLHRWNA